MLGEGIQERFCSNWKVRGAACVVEVAGRWRVRRRVKSVMMRAPMAWVFAAFALGDAGEQDRAH